jgi:hypothetical protein
MTDYLIAPKLDPNEEHFRISGPREGLSLFLRFLPAANPPSPAARGPLRSWRDVSIRVVDRPSLRRKVMGRCTE